MLKNKKLYQLMVMAIIMILFTSISLVVSNTLSGKIINTLAVLIMIGTVIFGLGISPSGKKGRNGIFALDELSEDLRLAEVNVNEGTFSLDDIDNNYTSHNLLEAIKQYKKEKEALICDNSNRYYCDISDYISYDLIRNTANQSYNELVSGMMTGLGILGTFVGLTIGLQGFNNDSAEEMMKTMTPLIEGIKVAFLTSIYGMILSLGYNIFYKKHISNAENALENFLNAYYEKIEARPVNEGFTAMLNFQEQQAQSIEKFAVNVAEQLGQQLIPVLKTVSENMPNAIALAFDEKISPTLEMIDNSMQKMVDNFSSSQSDKMDEIAKEFVNQMDKAMGNQLESLKSSIQIMCEWQETAFERMREIADRVMETGEKLGDVNESLTISANSFKDYIKNLDSVQHNLSEHFNNSVKNFESISEQIGNQNVMMKELISEENKTIQSIKSIEILMETKIKNLKSYVENQQKSYEMAIEAQKEFTSEQFNQMNDNAKRVYEIHESLKENMKYASDAMEKSSQLMKNASEDLTKNLDSAMERTYEQIDKELSEIVKHLSGTISDIRDVTENLPKIIKSSVDQSRTATADYISALQKSQKEMNMTVVEAIKRIENMRQV